MYGIKHNTTLKKYDALQISRFEIKSAKFLTTRDKDGLIDFKLFNKVFEKNDGINGWLRRSYVDAGTI